MVMMALFTDLTMRKATSFQQGFGIIGTKEDYINHREKVERKLFTYHTI